LPRFCLYKLPDNGWRHAVLGGLSLKEGGKAMVARLSSPSLVISWLVVSMNVVVGPHLPSSRSTRSTKREDVPDGLTATSGHPSLVQLPED